MNKVATVLLCINFITVLFPQPGYIHPDEFFQSSEIVAGDVLKVSHVRAWEFNSSFPVRSIVFPYLLLAPSLHSLQRLNATSFSGFRLSAVKLIMATRLPIAFLSVFGYLATGRLAKQFGSDSYLSVVLWSSSYVAWTYFTRTFSNSLEAVLLSVLLLLTVCQLGKENKKYKNNSSGEKESSRPKSKGGKAQDKQTGGKSQKPGKARVLEQEKIKPTKSHSDVSAFRSFLAGFIVVTGIFNRPTFVAFAVVPLFFWLLTIYRRLPSPDKMKRVVGIMFASGLGGCVAFCGFVLLDSLYFHPELRPLLTGALKDLTALSFERLVDTWANIKSLLVITPWNFFNYNSDPNNLSQHGVHPYYLHFLVNLPLLLGPLCIPFWFVCLSSLLKAVRALGAGADNSDRTHWLALMALFPVACLSVFPHQEPRFLIPCLPLMTVLGAKLFTSAVPGKASFLALWAFFNLGLTLLYGYMHQAALIPALSMYQQSMQAFSTKTRDMNHAIFLRTYPLPQHLLLQDADNPKLNIHDLAGAPVESLISTIKATQKDCSKAKRVCTIFVFLPSTVTPRVFDFISDTKFKISTICPHISFEALPRFRAFWNKRISYDEFLMDFCLNILKVM